MGVCTKLDWLMSRRPVIVSRLLVGVLLAYFDIGSDVAVIVELYAANNSAWASLLVVFITIHPLLTAGYYSYLYKYKNLINSNVFCWKLFKSLFMLEPMFAVISAVKRSHFSLKDSEHKDGSMISISILYLKLVEAVFESIPSAALQLYIVLVSHASPSFAITVSLLVACLALSSALFQFRVSDEKYGRMGFLIR